jgi:hypothetical protein
LASIGEKFEDTIQELKKTCKSKTAVPVDQVYPLFMQLAHLWSSWTDELFLLAFRRGILTQLESHCDSFTVDIPSEVVTECELYRKDIEPELLEDNKIVARAAELMARLASVNKSIEVLHPGNTAKYHEISLEYGGFCSYTLVERDGMIVPADKNVGIIRFRDRVFGFVSLQAALEFARTPDKYLEGVLQAAKQSYDLIQLCHLYGYFPTVEALEKAKSYTRQSLLGQKPMTTEISTQVDTHIVDTYVDPNYRWNEWELRRHALMLVNLKTKKTHSAQTNMSHYRRESETQYYPQK